MTTPRIAIDLNCNDGDNGLFRGTVEGISASWGRESIDLELARGAAPRLRIGDDKITLFRRKLHFYGRRRCGGNWCWARFVLGRRDAAFVLLEAIDSAKFVVDGAFGNEACALSDLLDADHELPTLDAIEKALAKFGADVQTKK